MSSRGVRAVAIAGVVILVLGGVALGVIGWVGASRGIDPAPATYEWTLADYPQLRPEPVRFAGSGGVTLAGRFFPGTSRATIVLSHGFGERQDQMLPWADFLNRGGFSVFTYDMRHRGESGGAFVTLGALEQHDLTAVIDYLSSRPDVDPARIGVLGLSLGGAVSLLAAADDPRIAAVVDDCGFSDAPDVVATSFEHFIGLPAWPFAPIAVRIAEWRAGVNINQVRPIDQIARISPRPLLIIHGEADTAVPPEHSRRLFAAAGEPKALWLAPGAGHAEARTVAGAEYERRVLAFFEDVLVP